MAVAEALVPQREAREVGHSAWRRDSFRGPRTAALSRRQKQALHRGVRWEGKRQWAETREVQARYKEKLFQYEDRQAGEQASQGGHAVSILGEL